MSAKKVERNAALMTAWALGGTIDAVAEAYGLCFQRCRAIINREFSRVCGEVPCRRDTWLAKTRDIGAA